MTKYKAHMQHVHNLGDANMIQAAVDLIIQDITDHLIKTGIKADSKIIKDVRELARYTYKPQVDAKKS